LPDDGRDVIARHQGHPAPLHDHLHALGPGLASPTWRACLSPSARGTSRCAVRDTYVRLGGTTVPPLGRTPSAAIHQARPPW